MIVEYEWTDNETPPMVVFNPYLLIVEVEWTKLGGRNRLVILLGGT